MSAVGYWLQFYGFLIQTVPVALLWYVPFPEEKLRISGRRLYLLLGGTLAAFALGFSLLSGFLVTGELRAQIQSASNLYMGITLVLETGFFFWNVRTGWEQKLLPILLMIHYAAILFVVCSTLVRIIYLGMRLAKVPYMVYGWEQCLVHTLLSLLTVPPLFLFLRESVRSACRLMERETARRSCIYFTAALLLFCVALYGLENTEYLDVSYDVGIMMILFAFLATDCILYIMFFHEMRMEARTRELEGEVRLLNSRYQQISSGIEEARRARHDIRHHLNAISVLNREGDRKGLEDYLARYEAVFRQQEERSFCRCPALDGILKYYVQKAEEAGIRVKTKISFPKEEPGIDAVDLTVLVGNLLDNAVMACGRLGDAAEKTLEISIRKVDASLLFLVKNSCERQDWENEEFEDYTAFPSTRHALREGYGLRSIHVIAEKYKGSAEFRRWQGTFTVRVRLNLPL